MAKSSVSEVHTTQGLDFIRELGQQFRVDGIRASTAAGSGHPTSSMSAADLMAVLITRYFHYDWNDPKQPNNDHLIFSKGHASPLLYAIFKAVGVVSDDELLTFRKFGSRLEGHPTPILPWVDVATGSLGQGVPIAVGVALAGARVGVADGIAGSVPRGVSVATAGRFEPGWRAWLIRARTSTTATTTTPTSDANRGRAASTQSPKVLGRGRAGWA